MQIQSKLDFRRINMVKIKKTIEEIKPYMVNNKNCEIKLDANESNYILDNFSLDMSNLKPNLYPDSDSTILRGNMANYYSCESRNIIVGNGSSELILTIINAFCEPNDNLMTFHPSFSMYEIYSKLTSTNHIKIDSADNYSFSYEKVIEYSEIYKPKIIIICNPNNPTGFYMEKNEIIEILDNVGESIIVLDEAYIDFGGDSTVDLINEYDNLIVMRTLSKAFGLAGMRIGCMISNENMIQDLWKLKLPYNLNSASQIIANKYFGNIDEITDNIKNIIKEREFLSREIKDLGMKVYPSKGNFIMVESKINNFSKKLEEKGILIRDFTNVIKNHYRITVGTKEENKKLLNAVKEILK